MASNNASGTARFNIKMNISDALAKVNDLGKSMRQNLGSVAGKAVQTTGQKINNLKNNLNALAVVLTSKTAWRAMGAHALNSLKSLKNFGTGGSQAVTKVKTALGSLITKLKSIDWRGNLTQGFTQMVNVWASGTERMRRALGSLRSMATNMIDGVRQITQGFLSMGRALTFFISIPLTAFLKEAIQSSVDYQEALTRVAKVAGWVEGEIGNIKLSKDVKILDDYIRDITSVARSSQSEFAKWAEQLGQFGVDSVAGMKQILPIMEMIVQGTDLSSDTAVEDLGKISNAFGYTMSSAGDSTSKVNDFLWRLVNTINVLENVTGSSAKQIVDALADAGPILGSSLEVPAYVVASWAALGIEAGLTTGEVGTGLRNLGIQFANHYQDLAKYPEFMKAMGWTTGTVLQKMKDDFGSFITETIQGLAKFSKESGNSIEAMKIAYDVLGMRGDKLFEALRVQWGNVGDDAEDSINQQAVAMNRFMDIMSQASAEFAKPTSLIREYEAMMTSTAAKMDVFKNGIKNIGLSVGDVLIPALNDLIRIATPVTQALANMFVQIPSHAKNTIFLVLGLGTILGPVVFFLSQMAFGLSLVAQGFMKVGLVIGNMLRFMGAIGAGMLRLNPIAWGLAASIALAFGNLKEGIKGVVDFITKAITGLISSMAQWGGGLFSAFATGIESAQAEVRNALQSIINTIAAFFQAFSPPKEGPLKHIDVWGKNLFDTYLEGFQKADFSILKDVASVVQHVFESWVVIGKLNDDGSVEERLLQFRLDFAKLLNLFNKTGKIDITAINKLTSVLGEQADEVARLIILNLRLKQAQMEIDKINKRMDAVHGKFRKQVRGLVSTNMPLEDKVALLQQAAKERDNELMLLDEEMERAEQRKAAVEEELELHREMLGAMQDQDDLFAQMIKAIESLSDKLGGLGDLDDLGGTISADVALDTSNIDLSAFSYFSDKIAEMKSKALELEILLRGTFKTIGAIIRGEPISALEDLKGLIYGDAESIASYTNRYKDIAKNTFESLIGGFKDSKESAKLLARSFSKEQLLSILQKIGSKDIASGIADSSVQMKALAIAADELGLTQEDIVGLIDEIESMDASNFENAFSTVLSIGEDIAKVFGVIKTQMDKLSSEGTNLGSLFTTAFGAGMQGTNADIDMSNLTGFEKLVILIGQLAGALVRHAPTIINLVGQIATALVDKVGKIFDFLGGEKGMAGGIEKVFLWIENLLTKAIEHPFQLILKLAVANAIISNPFGLVNLIGKGILALVKKYPAIITAPIKIIGKFIWGTLSNVVTLILKPLISFIAANPITLPIALMLFLFYVGFNREKFQENFDKQAKVQIEQAQKWNPNNPYPAGLPVVITPEFITSGTREGIPSTVTKSSVDSIIASMAGYIPSTGSTLGTAFTTAFKAGLATAAEQSSLDFIEKGLHLGNDFVQALTGSFEDSAPQVQSSLQNLFTVDADELQKWADLLNIDPMALLTGDVAVPEKITLPTPTLEFLDLGTKVDALVKSLMDKIVEKLQSTDFKIDDSTVAMAVFKAIASGLEKAFEIGTLFTGAALRIVEGLLTNFQEGSTGYAKIVDIGKAFGAAIETGLGEFFGDASNESSFINILTGVIDDLAVGGADLSTAFGGVTEGITALNNLIVGGAWSTFVSNVKTLGTNAEGGLPYVFEQLAYKITENAIPKLDEMVTRAKDIASSIQSAYNTLVTLSSKPWIITVIYKNGGIPMQTGGAVYGSGQTGGGGFLSKHMYRVGETGEELFTPPVSGHITSHSLLSNMMSQYNNETNSKSGNTYNLNVKGSPVTMTEDDLLRMINRMEFLHG